jgi:hypothetical protein
MWGEKKLNEGKHKASKMLYNSSTGKNGERK